MLTTLTNFHINRKEFLTADFTANFYVYVSLNLLEMKKSHQLRSIATVLPKPEAIGGVVFFDRQDMLLRFHISSRTLQEWRTTGVLPYYKIRNKIFYKESEVLEVVDKFRYTHRPKQSSR